MIAIEIEHGIVQRAANSVVEFGAHWFPRFFRLVSENRIERSPDRLEPFHLSVVFEPFNRCALAGSMHFDIHHHPAVAARMLARQEPTTDSR